MSDTYNLIDGIIRFESGEMDSIEDVVELFTVLKEKGILSQLQGFYQRTYYALREQGYID
jgi:hypothetical protein